jgi:tRNA pseudouridine13 synthase
VRDATGEPPASAWPTAHGAAPASGRIRATPDDFVVEERLGFAPDGAGSHVLLTVEKVGANTGWVAAQLARLAGVAVRDVGYCGHKDRQARTRQACSLPWPLAQDLSACLAWQGEGFRVLDAARHGRKLRPGSHRANRFVLTVRDVMGDHAAIERRLQEIRDAGVPNYFGPQRYGRGGANLRRAQEWAASGRAPRDRTERGFALSAARSHLFNRVLAERVRRGDWNRLLPGEAVLLEGSRSFFVAETLDATLDARLLAGDVHPSGPLPGDAETAACGEARAIEESAMADAADLLDLLRRERSAPERRSLRLPLPGLTWQAGPAATLQLDFQLPRGAFATAVLHELLVDAWVDAGGADE